MAHQKIAGDEWGGVGCSEMIKEQRSRQGRKKRGRKGGLVFWYLQSDRGKQRERERGWWLTQACKELRAAETD